MPVPDEPQEFVYSTETDCANCLGIIKGLREQTPPVPNGVNIMDCPDCQSVFIRHGYGSPFWDRFERPITKGAII